MSDPHQWNTRGWFVETLDELAAIDEMESASDRTAAIVIASLIEVRLTNAILADLHHNETIAERLFRTSGPLGSFASKIDLALLMGTISEHAHRDLANLKNIRNIFAHQLAPLNFANPRITDLCQNFRLVDIMICDIEEEETLAMKQSPFIFKVADYSRHVTNPRGRYTLTANLFFAGLDQRASKKRASTINDPWI